LTWEKGKQIETKQKIDKETVELKLKGNQKQFKLNTELDNIFDQTANFNVQAASGKIYTLVSESRKLMHKRQKQLKLLTDAKMPGRLFKNTNHASWLPIQRMERSGR